MGGVSISVHPYREQLLSLNADPTYATQSIFTEKIMNATAKKKKVTSLLKGSVDCKDKKQWLAYRENRLGASDAGPAFGWSPFMSKAKLYYTKIGELEFEPTDSMELGHFAEPFIAKKFEEATGKIVVDPGDYRIWNHPEYEWLFATPDRLGIDDQGPFLLELKATNAFMAREFEDGEAPNMYRIQLQIQMACTGIHRGYIYAMGDNAGQFFLSEHTYNARFMEAAYPHLERFHKAIANRVAPDFEDTAKDQVLWDALHIQDKNTILDLSGEPETWDLLIEDYRAWQKAESGAKAAKETIQRKIKRVMGDHGFLTTGKHWFTFKTGNREGYSVEPTTTRTLRYASRKPASAPEPEVKEINNGTKTEA